jgi:Carboxypeptidase regulatory-like domain
MWSGSLMGTRQSERYRIVLAGISVPVVVLLFCLTLLGQSATPPTQTQTFQVHGKVRSSSGYDVDGAKVHFQSGKVGNTVFTDSKGYYAADLPLGDYRVTVVSPGFRPIYRPFFRVESPTTIPFDFILHPSPPMTDVPIDPSNPAGPLQEMFEVPNIRPLSASDISAANRRHDAHDEPVVPVVAAVWDLLPI